MGGEITVQSEPGSGALFCVRIPFALLTGQADLERDPLCHDKSLPGPQLLAGLPCLVLGGPDGIAGDLATYLEYEQVLVETATDPALAALWLAKRADGLCVVVVDSAGTNSPMEQLRAAARAYPHPPRMAQVLRVRRRCDAVLCTAT
jgi:hypothetical protein